MSRALTIRHGQAIAKPSGEIVSLRQSSIVALAAHGLLDADQVAAAFRFRNTWSALEMQMASCPTGASLWHTAKLRDLRRKIDEPERVIAAKHVLRCCRDLLGDHGFDLVVRVCAEGYHIRDLCQTRRERDTMTDMLRIHLSYLASMFASDN